MCFINKTEWTKGKQIYLNFYTAYQNLKGIHYTSYQKTDQLSLHLLILEKEWSFVVIVEKMTI